MNIFENHESQVRSYCRKYPVVFNKSKGSYIYSGEGVAYLDFLSGAGALNYGHNNDQIKEYVIKYISEDNIMHALDMYTSAKEGFINTFYNDILKPRNLDHKIMFCGPTGTNAVEAALKLARKNTGRTNIIAFMGAFHGMSLGSLALTTDQTSRMGAGVPLNNVTFMPYGAGCNIEFDSLKYLESVLEDDHSGIDKPAAIIMETVQAEGGINIAPIEWLKGIYELCKKHEILLIVDDIQVGCSRCGSFFSFERAGIIPDMVILSKSIGGYGFPMSLLLIKPNLDIWKPAEHNGTFRGNQLAFVAAEAAIKVNNDIRLNDEVIRKEKLVSNYIETEIMPIDEKISYRGIGLIFGIDFSKFDSDFSKKVADKCFENNLIIERAGRNDAILKILPPLTIKDEDLLKGLNIIKKVIKELL